MPSSTLDADGGKDRSLGKGHGTEALGPSDSTDSGSDIAGGPGLGVAAEDVGLDRGTTEDSNVGQGDAGETAGPDIGDAELDSDSDRHGTGENVAAGRDNVVPDRDRSTDRIEGPGDPNVWGGEADENLEPDALVTDDFTDSLDGEGDDE